MPLHEDFESIYRFGTPEPKMQRFSYGKLFACEQRRDIPLLCITADRDQVDLLKSLIEDMHESLGLLYLLLVPRADASQEGRYQSAAVFTKAEISAFLDQFKYFLESDGRHCLWIKSVDAADLLVLDRHNLIYAYGPLEKWAECLHKLGWQETDSTAIKIPAPHLHRYHAIFDDDEKKLLTSQEWLHSPLREGDAY